MQWYTCESKKVIYVLQSVKIQTINKLFINNYTINHIYNNDTNKKYNSKIQLRNNLKIFNDEKSNKLLIDNLIGSDSRTIDV